MSYQLERQVLSAMMLGADAAERGAELLTADDFHDGQHRAVFATLAEFGGRGVNPDPMLVAESLRQHVAFADGSPIDLVASLIEVSPTASNLPEHARLIRESARLRKLAGIGEGIAMDARKPNGRTADELWAVAESQILGVERDTPDVRSLTDGLPQFFDQLEQWQAGGSPPGIQSGIDQLDRLILGLQDGELTVLAARPSMGKSALALTWGIHAVLEQGIPTLFVSAEMTHRELLARAIAHEARVDLQAFKRPGAIDSAETARIKRAADVLHNLPLHVDTALDRGIYGIASRIRRAAKRHGIGFVIVDYIQLLAGGRGHDSRRHEVDEITQTLKLLAISLDIPVLALSQLSRSVENRTDKRPQMSDLRESGGIEQDADGVLMLYREGYYASAEDRARAKRMGVDIDSTSEIIVRKQRNGATGTAHAHFQRGWTRFESVEAA